MDAIAWSFLYSILNFGIVMSTPYKLITKEAAAELLSVSKRTIDNWIADGTLPIPTSIGRRVYWHPDAFRLWQNGYPDSPVDRA